jgi:hypothetical protein
MTVRQRIYKIVQEEERRDLENIKEIMKLVKHAKSNSENIIWLNRHFELGSFGISWMYHRGFTYHSSELVDSRIGLSEIEASVSWVDNTHCKCCIIS